MKGSKAAGRGEGKRPKGGPSLPALLTALALAASTALCLSSCGLETLQYYTPPSFSYGGNIITLSHSTANTENFLGYDLYYRAYQSETTADSVRSTIESAASSTSTTPESVLAQLKTASFKKVYLADYPTVEQVPLIRVTSAGTGITYTIQPSNATNVNWYYSSTSDATKIQLVRGTGLGESFSEPYYVGDDDYTSSNAAITSGKTVYLVFFAIAYGINDDLSAIYSMPASLYATIDYTLP